MSDKDLQGAKRDGNTASVFVRRHRGRLALPLSVRREPCEKDHWPYGCSPESCQCHPVTWVDGGTEDVVRFGALIGSELCRGLLSEADTLSVLTIDGDPPEFGQWWESWESFDQAFVSHPQENLPPLLHVMRRLLAPLPCVVVSEVVCPLCEGRGSRSSWNGDRLVCEHSKCVDGQRTVEISAVQYVSVLCALECARVAFVRGVYEEVTLGWLKLSPASQRIQSALDACVAWTACPCPERLEAWELAMQRPNGQDPLPDFLPGPPITERSDSEAILAAAERYVDARACIRRVGLWVIGLPGDWVAR